MTIQQGRSEPRIAAIVITFNRVKTLQACVTSLREQTRALDAIVVADGDSQDGTREWLEGQPDLTTVYLANLGSAGSAHYALKHTYAQGYDWFWMMDDDVVADPDALAQLVKAMAARPETRVLNSYSTDEHDPRRPAVGALCWRRPEDSPDSGLNLHMTTEVVKHADRDGFLDGAGQLYQGTLIHRSVLERVGYPRTMFFTRGDEVDYALRIRRAGFHIYTFVPSRVTHPGTRVRFWRVLGREFASENMPAKQRYYSIRNSIYLRRTYYPARPFYPYVARRFLAALVTELFLDGGRVWAERVLSCQAIVRGVRDGVQLVMHPSVSS